MQELHVAMRMNCDETLEGNMAKMNPDQRRIFYELRQRLSDENKHVFMFISGAGGTGKSFLINTLKLWMNEQYGTDKKGKARTTVAVSAPTGLAAYNVNGVTLHRLLQLPVQHRLNDKYSPLSDMVSKEIRQSLKGLKLLVIDEISMVSNIMLAYVHLRLSQIFRADDKLFGSLNVILMGDLCQLPPVGDKPAFCPLTAIEVRKRIGGISAPDLWGPFAYDELTQSMRQRDDPEYANILNRLRYHQSTDEDISVLKKRLIRVPQGQTTLKVFGAYYAKLRKESGQVICLLPKTSMVAAFNEHMLSTEKGEMILLKAGDKFQWNGRPTSAKVIERAQKILEKKS